MIATEAKELVEGINLGHLIIHVDVQRLFTEEYPERPHDFLLFSVQQFYEKITGPYLMKDGYISQSFSREALTYAKRHTLTHMFSLWQQVIEGAQVVAISDAEKTGWYRDFEYDDVAELLASFMDDNDSDITTINKWKNVAEVVLPMAKKYNIPVETFLSSTLQRKKFTIALPGFNFIQASLKNGEIPKEKGEKLFRQLMNDCADQTVSWRKMQKKQQELRGVSVEPPEKITSWSVTINPKESKYWLVIPVNAREKEGVLQLLNDRVQDKMMNLKELQDLLSKYIRIEHAESEVEELKDYGNEW